uniref:Uncharacterized protein n=1 Tax=Oryza rufipogon TaxID=4529 RepID=A0A0E0NEG4_ORYRU
YVPSVLQFAAIYLFFFAIASIIFQLAAAYIIGSLIKLSLAAVLDINRSIEKLHKKFTNHEIINDQILHLDIHKLPQSI